MEDGRFVLKMPSKWVSFFTSTIFLRDTAVTMMHDNIAVYRKRYHNLSDTTNGQIANTFQFEKSWPIQPTIRRHGN